MKRLTVKFILITLIPLYVVLNHRGPYWAEGKCERVFDGDTVVISGRKVRLLYIDAPESKQWDRKKIRHVGKMSTEKLKSLCLNKFVQVKLRGVDRYQRYLGEIFYQGQSLNLLMVKSGMAFLYEYSKFENLKQKKDYVFFYKKVKKNKIGIFKTRTLKPITFRRKNKKEQVHEKNDSK